MLGMLLRQIHARGQLSDDVRSGKWHNFHCLGNSVHMPAQACACVKVRRNSNLTKDLCEGLV